MIKLLQIKTADRAYYNYVEQLLANSFPREEYRSLDKQRKLTDFSPLFFLNIILHENMPAGFVAWWNFHDFIFIEHLAIDPEKRNQGLGGRTLEKIKRFEKLPVVLETEPPTNEINSRRIAFYERNGFIHWRKPYLQPPYEKGNSQIELCLMATPELNQDKDFEQIKTVLYREVYGINESTNK